MAKRLAYRGMDSVRVRFGIAQVRGRTLGVKPQRVNGQVLPKWEQGADLRTFVKQLEAEDFYLTAYRAGEYVFERCDDILDS